MQDDIAAAMASVAETGTEAFTIEEMQIVALAPQLVSYLAAQSYPSADAINALPAGGSGGPVYITFSPQYSITGATNASELETVLRNHDEELLEELMDRLEDAGIDAKRRTY